MIKSIIFCLLIFNLGHAVFAAEISNSIAAMKAGVAQKALTDDEIFKLQVQRTMQRENFIKKNNESAQNKVVVSKKAAEFYEQALKSYNSADYAAAKKLFESAIVIQPENDQLYFDYGKSLNQQGLQKQALSIFLLLENSDSVGVKAKLYQGIVYFQMNLYSLAKKSFETVLDLSTDPKLDKLAEQYIENINLQEQMNLQLKKRFGYSLSVGLSYDDNVLNISLQDTATSAKAYRLSYGGSMYFHALNTLTERWSPTFTFSDIYSLDTKFKSDAAIQATDPLTLDFSFPYSLNFTAAKKASSFQISPGFQMLYMTKDTTKRELILNSIMLNSNLTFSHFDNLTTQYKFDISKDQSYLTVTSTDEDQSAQKYTVTVANAYSLDRAINENVSFDVAYLMNQAIGNNVAYNKITGSLGYAKILDAKWNSYIKLDYYNLSYSKSTSLRKDNGIIGYIGSGYSLSPNDVISFGFQYQMNQSNIDTYKYNKFLISTAYTLSRF
ncbi:MAG: hypothetical protein WA160_00480 [Pseudobdellovibrio sp.]